MGDKLQLSLSTRATVGTEEGGHCREVVGVERCKKESMYEMSVREVAVGWRFDCTRNVENNHNFQHTLSNLPSSDF